MSFFRQRWIVLLAVAILAYVLWRKFGSSVVGSIRSATS